MRPHVVVLRDVVPQQHRDMRPLVVRRVRPLPYVRELHLPRLVSQVLPSPLYDVVAVVPQRLLHRFPLQRERVREPVTVGLH